MLLRGLSQITFAFFGIFWPRTPLVCTFYVVNYAFFWPPTHPKCKRNLWKAPNVIFVISKLIASVWRVFFIKFCCHGQNLHQFLSRYLVVSNTGKSVSEECNALALAFESSVKTFQLHLFFSVVQIACNTKKLLDFIIGLKRIWKFCLTFPIAFFLSSVNFFYRISK